MDERTVKLLTKPFRVVFYSSLRLARFIVERMVGLVGRLSSTPPTFAEKAWSQDLVMALYVGGNLNLIDGSSVWTQTTAEVLHADPRVGVIMPLRFADKRPVITGALRRLDRVALIDSGWFRKGRGLRVDESVELIRWLDTRHPFDGVILRGYAHCLIAAKKHAFDGRLWSAYILEPERDPNDPEHLEGLRTIARASRYVLVQTEGMRALLESVVPEVAGKTLLVPPAVPPVDASPMPPRSDRLFYTGKFAPQYPFLDLVDVFKRLRREMPSLEFHVAGDKIHKARIRSEFAQSVERALTTTDGLTWHGGIPREDVMALLARGGIALNVWDPAYASTMNDLVVPSKTLDYCAAGVPVIAADTSTHRDLLGSDYPFFALSPADVEPHVRTLLDDPHAYEEAAERCRRAARAFTYEAVAARLRPAFDATMATARGR